ncbi:MAG: D-alanyl-D-alanine carboxypeptidase family protein [Acidimicrobiales bacterium]
MSRVLSSAVLLVIAAVAYVVVQVVRPAGSVQATAVHTDAALSGTAATLTWPSQGESAFGVAGDGVLASHGSQASTPLGSVTKIMTAYLLLHDHPVSPGAQGPVLTVSSTDVTAYQADVAATDSVVAVQAGEQLTELQALEALLIPSGDNIATMLATWDAGSVGAFVAKMNAEAKTLGLAHTHYADPAGVQPRTESDAADQVRLAMAAMTLPVFRSVVGMAQVTLPVAGLQYNVDALLGTDGIVGVKTGYIPQAGGCFVFATTTKVGTATETVVGVVLGQPSTPTQPSALTAAFDATTALVPTIDRSLAQAQVVHQGQTLGTLRAPWASSPVPLRAAKSVSVLGLTGERVRTTVELPPHVATPVHAGQHLGSAVVSVGTRTQTIPLEAGGSMGGPSVTWRLGNL